MSLPYEGIIDRGLCKFLTEFSTISTYHCNQTGGVFFALKGLLNTFINNKQAFFSEIVIYRNSYLTWKYLGNYGHFNSIVYSA